MAAWIVVFLVVLVVMIPLLILFAVLFGVLYLAARLRLALAGRRGRVGYEQDSARVNVRVIPPGKD